MKGLGFGEGYVAQGGDVGSPLAAALGGRYEECKAVHCGFFFSFVVSFEWSSCLVTDWLIVVYSSQQHPRPQ